VPTAVGARAEPTVPPAPLQRRRYVRHGRGEHSPGADVGAPLHAKRVTSYTRGHVFCRPHAVRHAIHVKAYECAHRNPDATPTRPHLQRDWAHPSHICTGTGLTPPTSATGLGSPLPHLQRDWAHPSHICTGTGLAPPTSAPGLNDVRRVPRPSRPQRSRAQSRAAAHSCQPPGHQL
jgi:hypothetical protein